MIKDFGAGVSLLLRGFKLVFSSPKRVLIGALPAVITTVLMITGWTLLFLHIDSIAGWLTGFADSWNDTTQRVIEVAVGISVIAVVLGLSVLLFTAITIMIGGPFYEYIAEEVEDELGGVPEAEQVGWWRGFLVGLRSTILLVGMSILFAVPLFLCGFIPVVGQTVVPVLAVCVNGYLLGIELTGIPFTRRGRTFKQRRQILATRRAMVLGFAVPAYLLCLIPLAAMVVIPAAMAGGTVLSNRLLTGDRAA
ncbi:EI24 domain-containing protein [Lentzea aerocolonigenes]|uniref:EI24 domain-containing protein n=1 Tax=Lentzea aerocolonigenes TaxID=68170 RepID=UPI0004C3C42C|nr:EI24 domain-containing protein [Lentzea aerocolonigenes]MCP2249717.1 CysZ protein [Lentzea aerocolonigenes]